MVGAEQVVHLWKEWGIQVLVLLSFMLQVMLLVLAEFRKSMDNGVLRAFIWLAYQLADSIAIYVLGHFSITSRSPRDQLMAFWAPFLLLHLGGQDNITAYAMEDNQLWLRHLQTMVVQVAACSYVLYKSSILSTDSLLRWATMLLFVASIVKYGERVWVLKRASSAPSGGNYRSYVRREEYYSVDLYGKIKKVWGTEALQLIAHHLLDISMDFFKGPTSDRVTYRSTILRAEEVYEVVEMQLSLMHDVLYTKAEVINTWYGICIRIILVLGTTAALILSVLQLGGHKDSYSIADVIVTYVLLVGALVLEITSLLRTMFSSWTCTLLLNWSIYDSGEYRSKTRASLCRVVASLRRLIHASDWGRRYWLGSVGQHNLLQLCARSKASRRSKIARWLGAEDSWNTLVYSWSIPISTSIKQLVIKQVLGSLQMSEGNPDHIINSRGRAALKKNQSYESLTLTVSLERDFQESILIWHIGTDVYLSWYKQERAKASGQQQDDDAQRALDIVEALSNYMLFLLATRPHMLPSPAHRNTYVDICYSLAGLKQNSVEDLARYLQRHGAAPSRVDLEDVRNVGPSTLARHHSLQRNATLHRGCKLGAQLINMESPAANTLEVMGQVWVEMLCYAGRRCSVDSHAKQLSSGGELVTIAALLVEHMIRGTLKNINLPAQLPQTV